jgi:hypothetical protein
MSQCASRKAVLRGAHSAPRININAPPRKTCGDYDYNVVNDICG